MSEPSIGDVPAAGMLVEWFDLVGKDHLAPESISAVERGREEYSARPGLIRKLLPISIDEATGSGFSGGSYLFERYQDAAAYWHWTEDVHRMDGLLFREQPFVSNFHGFLGQVVGAHDLKPLRTKQASKRIQVWRLEVNDLQALARQAWPKMLKRAEELGLSSVWLGVDPSSHTLCLVTVAPRFSDSTIRDYAALTALKKHIIANDAIPELKSGVMVLDKAMWILTIWLPPQDGRPTPGLWPNSPPLPAPPVRSDNEART